MKNSRTRLAVLFLVVLVSALAVHCFAQDEGQATTPQPEAPRRMSLWDMLKQGGWAMYPLGLCSFALIALIVMNFRQVSQKKMVPAELVSEYRGLAARQDIAGIWQRASASDVFFARGLAAGLRHINPDDLEGCKPRMEEAISEVVSRQESQTGFWINFLSLVAGIAPMLGLLGTVSGMIGAFQKIGAGGMGKPELLAADIGEALITTATGLTIAIPAMFFYFLFRNMLNRILVAAEEEYSVIMDEVTGTGITEIVGDEPVAEPQVAPASAPQQQVPQQAPVAPPPQQTPPQAAPQQPPPQAPGQHSAQQ